MKMKKAKIILKKVCIVILGSLLIGVSVNLFYVPVNLLGGGLTALAILSNIVFGTDIALISLILNIPILIIGYFFVDKEFMLLSTLGLGCMTIAIRFTQNIPVPSHNLMTCIIAGSLCVGLGAGVLLRQNSSCAGIDVLCRIFYKYFSISMGSTSLLINGIILSCGCYFLGLDVAIASIAMIFLIAQVVNYIVEGIDYKRTVIIISSKADEIAVALMEEFDRGVTLTTVMGAYSGMPLKQIMCAINPYQTPKLRTLVLKIDAQAFVTVNESISVIGGGFKTSDLHK